MAPNLNSYAERFAQTLRTECIDFFLICGVKHLRHLIAESREHYHDERPHQNLANAPPCRQDEPILPLVKDQRIHRTERLGGFLKHYFRKAA